MGNGSRQVLQRAGTSWQGMAIERSHPRHPGVDAEEARIPDGLQASMLRCLAATVNGLAWTGIAGLAAWLAGDPASASTLAVIFAGVTVLTLGGFLLLSGGPGED
jgi:hypothetical protein